MVFRDKIISVFLENAVCVKTHSYVNLGGKSQVHHVFGDKTVYPPPTYLKRLCDLSRFT